MALSHTVESSRSDSNIGLAQFLARHEWIFLLAITLLAASLRFYHLTSLPHGLQGDEASNGLEARRILREGGIGPYSQTELGQAAGLFYLDALAQRALGNSVLAIRLIPALLGTLCVPCLFVFVRRHLDFPTAAIAAFLLAVLAWHIHFSRVGFPLSSWVLCCLLAAWALLEAMRRDDWRWWGLAGGVAGIGIYAYNAHPMFLAVEFIFLIAYLFRARMAPKSTRAGWFVAFGAGLLLVALPMLRFALTPDNHYFAHAEFISVFRNQGWRQSSGPLERVGLLVGRYLHYWQARIWHSGINWVDGTGRVPLVSLPMAALAVAGMVMGWRRRQPLIDFAILTVLAMPVAVVFTVQGAPRRTFALAPFLAVLAAIGIVECYRLAKLKEPETTRKIGVALSIGCALIACGQLYGYFVVTARSMELEWVYCADLADAISFMKRQPPGSYFYFQSDRWSFNYEPRLYLVPEVRGQDVPFDIRHPERTYDCVRPHATYVLLGSFREDLDELKLKYPGGLVQEGPPTLADGRPSFIGYEIGR